MQHTDWAHDQGVDLTTEDITQVVGGSAMEGREDNSERQARGVSGNPGLKSSFPNQSPY